MSNRGIGRGRLFAGGFLLFAAVICWATAMLMNPYAAGNGPIGYVRWVVVVFMRNGAIGTLVLTAVAAYLLFPKRRPRQPVRDRALIAVIAILALTSVYQLIWLATSVAG